MTHAYDDLELVLYGWVDALRRRDPDRLGERLAPDIVWQGLRPDLVCSGREGVAYNIRNGGRHRGRAAWRSPPSTPSTSFSRCGSQRSPSSSASRSPGRSTTCLRTAAARSGASTSSRPESRRSPLQSARRPEPPQPVIEDPSPESPPLRAVPPPKDAAVDGLIPFVRVADIHRSIAFYRLLGLEVEETHEPRGRLVWASLANADARIMLAAASAPIEPAEQAVLSYLYTSDLARLRRHLLDHGANPAPSSTARPDPSRSCESPTPTATA